MASPLLRPSVAILARDLPHPDFAVHLCRVTDLVSCGLPSAYHVQQVRKSAWCRTPRVIA